MEFLASYCKNSRAVTAKYLARTRHKRTSRALLGRAHGAGIPVKSHRADALARGALVGAVVGRNTLDHPWRSSRALVAARTKLRDTRPGGAHESAWALDSSQRAVATVRPLVHRIEAETPPGQVKRHGQEVHTPADVPLQQPRNWPEARMSRIADSDERPRRSH